MVGNVEKRQSATPVRKDEGDGTLELIRAMQEAQRNGKQAEVDKIAAALRMLAAEPIADKN